MVASVLMHKGVSGVPLEHYLIGVQRQVLHHSALVQQFRIRIQFVPFGGGHTRVPRQAGSANNGHLHIQVQQVGRLTSLP